MEDRIRNHSRVQQRHPDPRKDPAASIRRVLVQPPQVIFIKLLDHLICYSWFAQHCQEVITCEWLDPLVDLIEIPVSEVFLVLEEDAHLPDEAF